VVPDPDLCLCQAVISMTNRTAPGRKQDLLTYVIIHGFKCQSKVTNCTGDPVRHTKLWL
jgi:hypothetical protein